MWCLLLRTSRTMHSTYNDLHFVHIKLLHLFIRIIYRMSNFILMKKFSNEIKECFCNWFVWKRVLTNVRVTVLRNDSKSMILTQLVEFIGYGCSKLVMMTCLDQAWAHIDTFILQVA